MSMVKLTAQYDADKSIDQLSCNDEDYVLHSDPGAGKDKDLVACWTCLTPD